MSCCGTFQQSRDIPEPTGVFWRFNLERFFCILYLMTDELTRNVRRAIAQARELKRFAQETRTRSTLLIARSEALFQRYDELERAVSSKVPPPLKAAPGTAIVR
jgi:hypothetical protein